MAVKVDDTKKNKQPFTHFFFPMIALAEDKLRGIGLISSDSEPLDEKTKEKIAIGVIALSAVIVIAAVGLLTGLAIATHGFGLIAAGAAIGAKGSVIAGSIALAGKTTAGSLLATKGVGLFATSTAAATTSTPSISIGGIIALSIVGLTIMALVVGVASFNDNSSDNANVRYGKIGSGGERGYSHRTMYSS